MNDSENVPIPPEVPESEVSEDNQEEEENTSGFKDESFDGAEEEI